MVLGCSDTQGKKAIDTNSSVQKTIDPNNSKISEELLAQKVDILYTINDQKYSVKTLPSLYTKVSGKKRKLFLDTYLNHKLVLDTLEKEQTKYQSIIDKNIATELAKRKRYGVIPNTLEKEILTKITTLRTIAREELAIQDSNLSNKIKQFYADKEEEYVYPDHVEVSYIVSKDLNDSKQILSQLIQQNSSIQQFASFAKKHSLDPRLKAEGGYAGFVSETRSGKKFFKEIWDTNQTGLLQKVITKESHFYIVYVHQRINAGKSQLDDVKDDIRNYLINTSHVNLWIHSKFKTIMKQTKVEIYDSFEDNATF